ncbi:MAG: aminopeptidase P family N-terminal domain-containing protein [Lachnospirales bacterium]
MSKDDLIKKIREQLLKDKIDLFIVTKYDPHKSEYSPDHYNYINLVSGFTGSTATLTITQEEVCLFVDGRYHIQAEKEVKGTEIKVQKLGVDKVPTMIEYIENLVKDGLTIGLQGEAMPSNLFNDISNITKDCEVKFDVNVTLLETLWEDRPALKNNEIFSHDIFFTGLSFLDKLEKVYEKMAKDKIDSYIIGTLEDIAWLLNYRGNDLQNSPTFRSYLVINKDKVHLFIDDSKIKNVTLDKKIEVHKYEDIYSFINSISEDFKVAYKNDINYKLLNSIKSNKKHSLTVNYTEELKAVKNAVELKNIEKAYEKDCVALVRAIKKIKENAKTLTEVDVDRILIEERSKMEHYLMPSFDTIAGYMSNGALMHYKATEKDFSKLDNKGFLLIDSGSHFLDGTTDITRTIVLGDVTEEMKKDFTFVLRSMIRLSSATFLKGATGAQLDMFSRVSMWENQMDYKSGTGHGIGFCLGVHEGPNGIGTRSTHQAELNMLYSNEPGVYKENKYGIRTENTIYVKEVCTNDDGIFYGFDTVSFFPIDVDAIDKKYLSENDILWLNNYHKETYAKLSPFLNEEEKNWLKNETREI